MNSAIGQALPRREDERLVRGAGRFVDDIPSPLALHAAFVRSPLAHARIVRIESAAAVELPGVVAVYTHADLGPADVELPLLPVPPVEQPRTQPLLARGEVCFVGQTIAMVVAESRAIVQDALERIEVEFEQLPVVVDIEAAVAEASPLTHADMSTNIAATIVESVGDVESAFAGAEIRVRERFVVERSAGCPIETRGILADYDSAREELVLWFPTQKSHAARLDIAALLGLADSRVRVIVPDVGGGFGPKSVTHPEDCLVPWAATQLERPVKWIESRTEHFIGTTHERRQVHDVEIAATADGRLLAVRDAFLHDHGAYLHLGLVVPGCTASHLGGPYRIPNIHVEYRSVYTNTVPIAPYRGAGRPQAVFVTERMLDLLARRIGVDRAEIRRRNLLEPQELPHKRHGLHYVDGFPVELDSGNYPALLDKTLEAIGYEAFSSEQEDARAEGRQLGLGIACFVEATSHLPYEGALVRVEPASGKVHVATGVSTQGQGHETTLAQVAADGLGVDPADVEVTTGDTAAFPWGVGAFSSRTAVVAGNAVALAAGRVRELARKYAARMLEAAPDDLDVAGGRVFIKGSPARSVTLKQVAIALNPMPHSFDADVGAALRQFAPARDAVFSLPPGEEPGLEATAFYSPEQTPWAAGALAVVAEVDAETGSVRLDRMAIAHDCGVVINPLVVDGQTLGGLAHGIGSSLYERIEYDQDGQLLNPSFLTFLIPSATEMPPVSLVHMESPSPTNALGLKGTGETGTLGPPAAIASAIEDALTSVGVTIRESPLDPCRLRSLIVRAREC
jgi:aerobic carbon-monoxide dehydrogenase large subunit